MKPVGAKVLIRLDKKDNVTEGGIIIPSSYAKDKPSGTILKVGNGTKDEPMKYHEGERVCFDKGFGIKIEYEGQDCLLLDQGYILFVKHSG